MERQEQMADHRIGVHTTSCFIWAGISFSFCLNSSRDGKLTTQKFRFYCGVAVPHVSTGSHMELHFTGPWGRGRRYKRRNGEEKNKRRNLEKHKA